MVPRSLRVTVWSLRESKSTVMAKGMPHSSVLAYLLPMEVPESSTLEEMLFLVNSLSTLEKKS